MDNIVTGTMAIIGSGYMGGGIAQVFALAGTTVLVADVSADIARQGRARLLRDADDFVRAGIFPPDAVALLEEHVVAADSLEAAVADADFVEEAVPEDFALKRETLRRVGAAARGDAIIATNTSAIAITDLASAVPGPERFLGVHFMNPAPFIPGVEVIVHPRTDPATLAATQTLLARAGKVPVAIKDTTGFVVNRLQYALFSEAARVLAEGVATAQDIDNLVRSSFGFRLALFGPFAIADMAGLDVYRAAYGSLQSAYPDRFSPPQVLDDLVQAGDLGVKTGAGFFRLDPAQRDHLVAYRDRAYAALGELIRNLGPSPHMTAAAPTDASESGQ